MNTGVLALIIFIAIVISIWLVGYLMYVILDLIINTNKSLTYNRLIKIYKRITKLPSKLELNNSNKLYVCSYGNCSRMFREYQLDMYNARHNQSKCPHCENTSYTHKEVGNLDKWMDTHPDCPKLTNVGYKNILKTIDLLHKLRKDDEQQQRFEEYNKLKVDFSWVKNLELEKDDIK